VLSRLRAKVPKKASDPFSYAIFGTFALSHDNTSHNCHKKGHMKADCWAKGGGKEGQGLWQQGGVSDSAALASAAKDKDAIEAWVVIDGMDLEESWTAIEEVSDPKDFQLTAAAATGHTLVQAG
jgi:hypothetical protein